MESIRRPTMRDVAREAGVSQTTVSFVLNDRADQTISPATRSAVLEAVDALGYVPSGAARSLRLGRSHVIACIVPDLPVSEAQEVSKREISHALEASGYSCAFFFADDDGASLSDVWQHLSVAGVISIGPLAASVKQRLQRASVPLLDGVFDPGRQPPTGFDQHRIGALQVHHLHERGHRHLGFAAARDPRDGPFSQPRLDGARRACRELGLPEPDVVDLAATREDALAAVHHWLDLPDPVTAIAGYNDAVALAVHGACATEGIAVPHRLALIGVDDLPVSDLVQPRLSTVAMDLTVPARGIAARMIRLVQDGVDPGYPVMPRDSGPVLRVIGRDTT